MGRVETVDAAGLVNPGRGLETQDSMKAMKETQFALKWLGRGSPDRNGAEDIDVNPTRQQSQKADTGHRSRNLNSIVKARELSSAKPRAQHTSREKLPETGRGGGRISDQNPTKNEDDAFELFKKEFVARLAEKAKERPGYLLANEDFVRPATDQQRLLKQIGGDFVKPVKENLKLSNQSDFGKPVEAQSKLFNQTESLDQPSSFAGPPNSKRGILAQTVRIIESSKIFLQSSSLEKRKSSPPTHEKSSTPSWMSKYDKFNLNPDKQPWSTSKDIEESSKEFILNKFFHTPTKRTPSDSVYDVDATDGESETPRAFSSRRRIVPTEHNAAHKTKDVRQLSLDEKQNLGQMTVETENSREAQGSDLGEIVPDRGAQIRREMSRTSSGSPGRRLSSEDRRKDSSRSPGRVSSEERRKDSSRSPGRKLSSAEKRKDSSQFSTRSIGGVFAAEDLRLRDHEAIRVLNESKILATQPELLGIRPNSGLKGNRSPHNELQQESVRRERDSMLKSVKKAAAVDQAHFLRALQDNGTVQSTSPISKDFGYSCANGATLQRPSSPNRSPSSPNRTKNSDNLREAKGRYRVDVPLREFLSEARETQSREPSPTGRREPSSFGSSTRNREPSPTSRRDPASLGSSTRSTESSPTGRREAASYGASGSTNAGRMASPRRSHSIDSPSEKSSLRSNGEIRRTGGGERSQLPSGSNSPSCASPRLSRQSSLRSIEADENESVSGGSIIEKLMRKASLRKSSSFTENQTISSSVPASPNHRSAPPPSSDSRSLRRTLSFADLNTDTSSRQQPESSQEIRASSPRSGGSHRKSSSESNFSEDLPRLQSERKSAVTRVTSVLEQSAAPAPSEQHPLSNSLRVNVQVKESTIAKLKSRSSTSPVTPDSQKPATVDTVEEAYPPTATPERTLPSVTAGGGSPWSPGSDDSGSEASGIEQPSPVSVLPYNNNRRTPFQEDSRLSPLEHKIQVLHERIRKSKIDVTNQKKARLQKIKATEAELSLCVIKELKADELPVDEVSEKVPPLVKAPQLLLLPVPYIEETKKPLASVIAVTRDEKLVKTRPAGPISDFCTSLETCDIKSILPWAKDKKWDLVYIRDVLLVSSFGRDRSTMTKWHSVTEPMDPCLFDKLEEYYKLGKKFSGSQFLSSLKVPSTEGGPHLNMQEHVQRVFLNPANAHRAAVDSMNRCHLFDVVNETLAKKLVPYVALPRPWMKPLAKPVVRPRPIGSALMQEIWADIYDQIGNNGSMSMDKAQLHQSLEDLILEDLFKRSDLFPCREIERAAERVGIELERRILDDLLHETVTSIWNSI